MSLFVPMCDIWTGGILSAIQSQPPHHRPLFDLIIIILCPRSNGLFVNITGHLDDCLLLRYSPIMTKTKAKGALEGGRGVSPGVDVWHVDKGSASSRSADSTWCPSSADNEDDDDNDDTGEPYIQCPILPRHYSAIV